MPLHAHLVLSTNPSTRSLIVMTMLLMISERCVIIHHVIKKSVNYKMVKVNVASCILALLQFLFSVINTSNVQRALHSPPQFIELTPTPMT